MTSRRLIFMFGIVAYLVFLLTVVYGIGFIGDMLVPKSLDKGQASPPLVAVFVDLALIALFGVQHSVMARQSFKAWLKRWIPGPVERSVYVLFSSLCLLLLFWWWRPVPATVWDFADGPAHFALTVLFWFGWALVLMSSFLINHFDLFGLRQVWLYLRGIGYTPIVFEQPALYKFVRHPLMLGFLIAFWATPHMSIGHLIFAAGMTVYIFAGIALEERDLLKAYGDMYKRYRDEVAMLIPMPAKKRTQSEDWQG